MPDIRPFKAVRPTRDKVGLIVSRSYDSYNTQERVARLRDNPYSFLHIVNPGFKYQKVISGKERYRLVRNRYQEFKEDGIFIHDPKPGYYVYRIINRDGEQFTGLIAAASVADYREDRIKKHEDTIAYREEIFKDYLKTVGFNAEAVLMMYPDQPELELLMNEVMKERAEYEFSTTYRDTHYLWHVDDKETVARIGLLFKQIPAVYIADGHHRCSSSSLLAHELQKDNPDHHGEENYNFFMSYLIPESSLKIYHFNRLIKDLNGLSKEEFLIRLDEMYRIKERGSEYYKPSKKHHFSMYIDGSFYSLYLRKNKYKASTPQDELDAQILYTTVLQPILGITDLRSDQRIDYAHGKMAMAHVKSLVDSRKYVVGFGSLPVTVDEMKLIADAGQTMPPKSTYIEPKLRSGLTIYEF